METQMNRKEQKERKGIIEKNLAVVVGGGGGGGGL